MQKQDRSYYRHLEADLLVEAGLDSKDELTIALAERLEDFLWRGASDEVRREMDDLEHKLAYYQQRAADLENEIVVLMQKDIEE